MNIKYADLCVNRRVVSSPKIWMNSPHDEVAEADQLVRLDWHILKYAHRTVFKSATATLSTVLSHTYFKLNKECPGTH